MSLLNVDPSLSRGVQNTTDFVSKVYSLLGLTLLFAAGGAWYGMSMPAGAHLPIIIAYFVLFFAAQAMQRAFPLNLILLFAFTTTSGLLIGPVINSYVATGNSALVTQAFGITAITFGGLSVYVNVTKKDFTFLGGALFIAIIGLILMGLVLMFFQIPLLSALYGWAGLVIFSGYVLYQTSLLTRAYNDNEYIAATIGLYLSFINPCFYLYCGY